MSLSGNLSQNNLDPLNRRKWRLGAQVALSSHGMGTLGYDIATCGDRSRPGAVVYCDNCGNSRAITFTCHSRLCPDCERRAQAARLAKYLPVVALATHHRELGYKFRHVTITTNISLNDPDANAKSSAAWDVAKKTLNAVIYRQFEYLEVETPEEKRRKQVNWKKRGIGALAGGEYGERGLKFHMHFFIYSPFLEHSWLVEELLKASGGEWRNVDVKAKNDALDAKEIVAKYATKLSELPVEMLPKLHKAIEGQRRIRNYGIWHGVTIAEDDEQPCQCRECGNKLRFEAIESALEWSIVLKDIDGWYTWRHGQSEVNSLILKHGNNSSEKSGNNSQWRTPLLL